MLEKEYDVFTIADLCVDIIVIGDNIVPEFGQKEKLVDEYILELGGSCSICACQLGKLGLKTQICGHVGKDIFGDTVIKKLKDSNVFINHVRYKSEIKTGMSISLSQKDDRAILTYNGSIDSNTVEELPWEALFKSKHLHIGSYFLQKRIQPYIPYIAKEAKSNGLTVSLDINWDPEEQWQSGLDELLDYVDIFFPNEEEAKAVTNEMDVIKAANKLAQKVSIVVVKRGHNGAIAKAGDKLYVSPSLDVEVHDTIGAGDSFDAGFIYGYLSDMDVESCLSIASICGGLNTSAYGGIAGQPTLEKVFELYPDFVKKVKSIDAC